MAAPLSSYDPLANIELLADPSAVEIIATQLNDTTLNQNRREGAARIANLSDAITDIEIEDSAQGASVLVVTIADPYLYLTTRPSVGQPAFIDVDDAGLLIPVDVNFPETTDCWWRIAAADSSLDTSAPNLILTFEDRNVSLLRDLGAPIVSGAGQTRAQFIYSLVRQVPSIRFVCPALTNPPAGTANPIIAPPAPAPPRPKPHTKPAPTAAGKLGAVWTPSGWKYTKPMNGLTVTELNILNPPTNQPEQYGPGASSPSGAAAEPNT
jgi:hypothetical protein